ncbi:MAG TPA: hypothetical protein VGK95_02040 [Caldimonas sp.]
MPHLACRAPSRASRRTNPATSAIHALKEPSASAATNDATALLQCDHADARSSRNDKLADEEAEAEEQQALAEPICAMLTAHATIEEEFFSPRRAKPRSRATCSTKPRSSTPLSRV